jgi:hypothetical protein
MLFSSPDVQDFCRKLSDKDELITSLQQRNKQLIESSQREFNTEKSMMVDEKIQLEIALSKTR